MLEVHLARGHIGKAAGCCLSRPTAVALAADIVVSLPDYRSALTAAEDGCRTEIAAHPVLNYNAASDRSSAVVPA